MPVYVFSVAKDQPKLRAAENSSASGCQSLLPTIKDVPYGNIQCRNATLDVFANAHRRLAPASFNNLAVVNSTDIEGTWDIDIQYPMRSAPAPVATRGRGIFDAIEKQLGLKLEMGTAPQPVLVVESVIQQPSPNPPGIAESLPTLPPP